MDAGKISGVEACEAADEVEAQFVSRVRSDLCPPPSPGSPLSYPDAGRTLLTASISGEEFLRWAPPLAGEVGETPRECDDGMLLPACALALAKAVFRVEPVLLESTRDSAALSGSVPSSANRITRPAGVRDVVPGGGLVLECLLLWPGLLLKVALASAPAHAKRGGVMEGW